MAFEALKAEIAMLVETLEGRPPDDKYEVALLLHNKIQELKAFGMPVPQDLIELEQVLDAELQRERMEQR
ncbi:MAG TPA: hypothetical protein VFV47_01590 [Hyphomicrobiaceae bacterium]|nr:hypothetical protein [Hyphomicrobiaceae bacterium]